VLLRPIPFNMGQKVANDNTREEGMQRGRKYSGLTGFLGGLKKTESHLVVLVRSGM